MPAHRLLEPSLEGLYGTPAELVLDLAAGAVAPGQAAVLYDGERVLGGGWIRRPALTGLRPSPISEPLVAG